MDVGFVEDHAFAVAPAIALPIHARCSSGRRSAWPGPGDSRSEPENGSRCGFGRPPSGSSANIAAFTLGQGLEQGHRARAQGFGRGMAGVVPLQVEALPAVFEKRIEADVVVALRRLDAAHFGHLQRFVADDFPVVLQNLQFGDFARGHIGRGGHARGEHHEGIHRRQQDGVVQEDPRPGETYAAAMCPYRMEASHSPGISHFIAKENAKYPLTIYSCTAGAPVGRRMSRRRPAGRSAEGNRGHVRRSRHRPVPFVHLRVHSEFSVVDGTVRISDLGQARRQARPARGRADGPVQPVRPDQVLQGRRAARASSRSPDAISG